MKKTILFILILSVSVVLQAQTNKSISDLTAGEIENRMNSAELKTITKLTLSGSMDARDFRFISFQMPQLSEIDITNVLIAEYTGDEATDHYETKTYPANVIPEWAFSNLGKLTSMVLPVSISSIGNSAFCGCTDLTSVVIPPSVTTIEEYAFTGCVSLRSINIPNSVTSIGIHAFTGSGLTSITLPSSVTTIGEGAFSVCYGLTSVNLPNSVTSIGEAVFSGCTALASLTIPSSVTIIGPYFFEGCTALTTIILPNSVTRIEDKAFVSCTSLKMIDIPASVNSIDDMAFEGCPALLNVDTKNPYYSSIDGVLFNKDKTELIHFPLSKTGDYTVPLTVKIIHHSAFSHSQLTSVFIPDSVTTIDGAFMKCTDLIAIVLPNSITVIGDDTFSGCTNLKSVIFPNSITMIGQRAFSDCSGLTSVMLPTTVTTIGDYAFFYCTGLTYVGLPNSVTTIGQRAFAWCYSISSFDLPASVRTIGDFAFTYCRMANFYANKSMPVELFSDIFDGMDKNNCTLYVPAESYDLYKAANVWKEFFKIGVITSSIKGIKNEVISVSPNPAKDVITVHAQKGVAFIYNSNGKLEITQPLEENKQVNISSLKTGMYVVVVNGKSVKLIKE